MGRGNPHITNHTAVVVKVAQEVEEICVDAVDDKLTHKYWIVEVAGDMKYQRDDLVLPEREVHVVLSSR